jgi:hypothetical protein
MVNTSTNINKTNNNLSPNESLSSFFLTIPPISTKQTIISHLKKVETVMVNTSTNINKTNNNLSPKESLNNEGQQFHQYQQNKQ